MSCNNRINSCHWSSNEKTSHSFLEAPFCLKLVARGIKPQEHKGRGILYKAPFNALNLLPSPRCFLIQSSEIYK